MENPNQAALMKHISKDVYVVQVDAGVFQWGFATFGYVYKDHNIKVIVAASRKKSISID